GTSCSWPLLCRILFVCICYTDTDLFLTNLYLHLLSLSSTLLLSHRAGRRELCCSVQSISISHSPLLLRWFIFPCS
ncbi:AAEL017469-PA, partial [Aedes aegypti]